MKKVLLLMATGFEEGETVTIVDVLRRANFQCDMVSTNEKYVTGVHDIVIKADIVLGDDLEPFKNYDMIVLPGGWIGVDNLIEDSRVTKLIRYYDQQPEKFVTALCAAPAVLAKAGITSGRTLTAYPSSKIDPLFHDANYREDAIVNDEKLITGRAPALALPFAFALVDALGGDSNFIKNRFLYNMLTEQR